MRESIQQFVESWLPYERNLFFLLNGSDSAMLDSLMHTISQTQIWFPFYLFVVFVVFFKTPVKQSILVTLIFVLLVTLTDQLSASVARPFFERYRPGHHPDFKDYVQLVSGRGGLYGFFSSHATNVFGFATMLWLVFRNKWATLVAFTWATAIAYSRIYLGRHFVTDVIAGIIVGMLIAVLLYYCALRPLYRKLLKLKESQKIKLYAEQNGKILWIGFTLYFAGVVIYSLLFYGRLL
ncbi:MAG: phosphatase PAP2 family protein [Bacteroidales bacterium]|nr:phosphatase PAP2 family protein [Bacteroidales bacterium]